MRDIRVATVQFEHAPSDKAYNLDRIRQFVTAAAKQHVELIAFPEMCITGYWHVRKLSSAEFAALAEPVPDGASSRELRRLSREHGMTIGAGLLERGDDGRIYNAYVVAMPDGRWALHRKLHVFEHRDIAPGDRYTVFDTPHGCRVGVLICYDNNIVENARATALAGAEILLAPHQTGGCDSVSPRGMKPIDQEIWARRADDPAACEAELCGPKGRGWLMRWLPSRAHDNGMFLLFANGIGVDDDEIRTGNAMILDPYGEIVAESRALGDDMVVADLDASLLPTSSGRRWLKARRPELYETLTRRTGEEIETRRVRFGE
ncbi:MAG TPA: nitrilase family protein [Gemmatimonadaceae bacterium]|nr:nitrilase family protein [Gemmatimonadaceae bacterium]